MIVFASERYVPPSLIAHSAKSAEQGLHIADASVLRTLDKAGASAAFATHRAVTFVPISVRGRVTGPPPSPVVLRNYGEYSFAVTLNITQKKCVAMQP